MRGKAAFISDVWMTSLLVEVSLVFVENEVLYLWCVDYFWELQVYRRCCLNSMACDSFSELCS